MKRHTVLVLISLAFLVGCQPDDKHAASPAKPTPPDVKELVAEFTICKTAKFVERKPLKDNRELLLFLADGSVSVDLLKEFEQALVASGWKSKGKRPQTNKKYPSQQESVYERDGTEMSFWYGGSLDFVLIGITLPKQEDARANKAIDSDKK